ncbi:MAG: FHA domain-containing protein [Verrucomicrobia bacterium]|nr:FHA domain-containing protein [Verrucomicrobiota bacterium]
MPAKITLRITQGALAGQEFVFEEASSCVVGRSSDCSPRIPDDKVHETISRHHCLLDINPPDIRVRDFGSLNGTAVNGKPIGQRQQGMTPEEGAKLAFPEHDLKHGDELRLGETVFRVEVFAPAQCAECAVEIPEDQRRRAERLPGVLQCEACRKKAELVRRPAIPKRKPKVCARCGRDVTAEVGAHRQGEYVCARCQRDPFEIMRKMLGQAGAGARELQAIRGYTLECELGHGGFGAVYLARKEGSGEQVALKVMLPRAAMNPQAKERFLREVANTEALRHRHVVEFRESGCSQGTFFFTMEYCRLGSIDKLMERRGGRLPLKEAVGIACEVLDGLEYAHHATIPNVRLKDGRYVEGHGLVHRDLSPHNILLTEVQGVTVAKVSDYGLSKAFDTAGLSGLTRTKDTAGKPLFMPRQQVTDFLRAGPEVDVWAAAASLYNMLTGAVPRDFPPGKDVWVTLLETQPVPIRRRDPGIPARLAAVIDRALIDKPAIVFKTAASLKQALLAAL